MWKQFGKAALTGAYQPRVTVFRQSSTLRNANPESVFVVTGANRGLGLEFVKQLMTRTQGRVVACCRDPVKATDLGSVSSAHSGRLEVCELDLEDQDSIQKLGMYSG